MIHKYKIQRWLGLTDMGREGEWVWLHSSQVEQKIFQRESKRINPRHSFPLFWLQKANFTMWGRGAPSGKKKNAEDCAYFVIHKGLMVWRDLPCGWVFVLYSGLEWFAESRDQNVQGEEVGVVCQRGEAVLTAPASTFSNTTYEKTAAKEKELTKLYNQSRF